MILPYFCFYFFKYVTYSLSGSTVTEEEVKTIAKALGTNTMLHTLWYGSVTVVENNASAIVESEYIYTSERDKMKETVLIVIVT